MKNFLAGFLIGECSPMNIVMKPLLTFGFRFYLAYVFFKSGLSKVVSPWGFDKPFADFFNADYSVSSSTIDLFKHEYNVPLLPPELAAYLATYAEIVIPIMLILGILTRPAALGLFILNAVAMLYVAKTDFATIGLWQHSTWGVMLAVIFTFGPGKISIDNWMSNKLYGKDTSFLMTLASIIIMSAIAYFLASKYI